MDSDSVIHHVPARIAELGFSLRLPRNWQAQPLPDESPAFDDPRQLAGLAAITAPYAALVLAAAARPAFEEGTVHDWALWLVQQDSDVALRALGPSQLGALPAIVGQCSTASDLGEMLTFFACAEDGGRLLHISLTGPAVLQAHVLAVWQDVLASFALDAPRGATVALVAAPEVPEPAPGSPAPLAEARHSATADAGHTTPPAAPDSPAAGMRPAWALQARGLEEAGRLAEAEQVMRDGCDHLGVLMSIAEMHRRHMQRLAAAGDSAGAAQAREQAVRAAWAYAAGATSGGEGAALSRERDAFIAQLGPA